MGKRHAQQCGDMKDITFTSTLYLKKVSKISLSDMMLTTYDELPWVLV